MENQVLSNLELIQVLSKYYNVSVINIEKINNSSTLCYVINSKDNKYFVKVFNKNKDVLKINQEYILLNELSNNGFYVPSIIKNNSNQIYTYYKEHYLLIEKYINGYSYDIVELNKSELLNSSKILGKMHSFLNKKYDDDKKELYWKELSIENESKFLNSILELLDREKKDENFSIIRDAICHKMSMLSYIKEMSKGFNDITYLMTHGDYSKRNLLCDENGNMVVVDFSDSGVYPASWELIRSYFFSTESCKNGKIFDYDLFCKYVNTYLEEFKLNVQDIKLMPYLFLYQILISRYGYYEYLKYRDLKLIDFIKWKESITYFLEENSESIVRKL